MPEDSGAGRYEAGITNTVREGNIVPDLAVGTNWTNDATTTNAYWDSQTVVVKQNSEPIRMIMQTEALKKANEWDSRTGVVNTANSTAGTVAWKSGLITGAQWDSMCKFIDWTTCNTNCTNWGNYGNAVGKSYTGNHSTDCKADWVASTGVSKKGDYTERWIFPTGSFVNSSDGTTEKKHIFDVAGNCWEWTTEIPINGSGNNAVIRGGSADGSGADGFATSRYGYNSASTYAVWGIGFRLVLYVQ